MPKNSVDYEKLDKEELIKEVLRLKEHVVQLRNVIAKKDAVPSDSGDTNGKVKVGREFNFKRFRRRHIALKLLYLGWDYDGFVVQENTSKTIERALFDALLKTKLIESRETSNYHRCGRTDVNVSAFSQVISLDVRTNLIEGRGVFVHEGFDPSEESMSGILKEEINFTKLLNQALPDNIRIISWAPVDQEFSARFDCTTRSYKYILPVGHLDIENMRQACKYFLGSHDFRNFCKFDRMTPDLSTMRSIDSVDIKVLKDDDGGYKLIEFVIRSHAFLWHQIRCIVAVLIMVGEGKEQPDIIKKLLDVDLMPDKPQYSLAPAFPLILFDCQFDYEKLESWIVDHESIEDTIKRLQSEWTNHEIKCQMVRCCLNELQPLASKQVLQQCDILITERSRTPKPLDQRPICSSSQKRLKGEQSNVKVDGP